MLFLRRRLRGSPSQRTEGTRAPLFPRFPNGRRRCATHAHSAGRGGRLRCGCRGAEPARRCHAVPLRVGAAGAVGMEIRARPRAGFLHELRGVLKEQAAEAKKSHFGKEIGECLRCAPRCSAPRPALRTAVAVCHGALQPAFRVGDAAQELLFVSGWNFFSASTDTVQFKTSSPCRRVVVPDL